MFYRMYFHIDLYGNIYRIPGATYDSQVEMIYFRFYALNRSNRALRETSENTAHDADIVTRMYIHFLGKHVL